MKNTIHRAIGIIIGIYMLPMLLLVYPYSRFVEGDDITLIGMLREWANTFILDKPDFHWSL